MNTSKDLRPFLISIFAIVAGLYLSKYLVQRTFSKPNPRSQVIDLYSDDTEILIVGTSHIYHGIDPSKLKARATIIGLSDVDLATLVLVTKKILPHFHRVKQLWIELSPEILAYDIQKMNYGSLTQVRDFGVTFTADTMTYLRRPDLAVRDAFWPLFRYRIHPIDMMFGLIEPQKSIDKPPQSTIDIIKNRGFEPLDSIVNVDLVQQSIASQLRRFPTPSESGPGNVNLKALLEAQQIARKHNLPVVFISTPRLLTYLNQTPQHWKTLWEEALEFVQNFQVIDKRCCHNSPAEFADPSHLNRAGAARFTQELDSLL